MIFKKKAKKGNVTDILTIIIYLFLIFVAFFLTYFMFHRFTSSLSSSLNTPITTNILATGDKALASFNYLFVMVFVLMVIFLLVSAYFIRVHPLFIIPSILLFLFIIFISIGFSRVHRQIFIDNDLFSPENEQFEASMFIINHLPIIMTLVGGLVMVVLFAKPNAESGGGGI